NFHFYDEWTTYFSPVYSIYDHWWADPATGKDCLLRWKVYVFFTPRDGSTTALTSFVFASSQYPSLLSDNPLVRWLLVREADYGFRQDIRIFVSLVYLCADLGGL